MPPRWERFHIQRLLHCFILLARYASHIVNGMNPICIFYCFVLAVVTTLLIGSKWCCDETRILYIVSCDKIPVILTKRTYIVINWSWNIVIQLCHIRSAGYYAAGIVFAYNVCIVYALLRLCYMFVAAASWNNTGTWCCAECYENGTSSQYMKMARHPNI